MQELPEDGGFTMRPPEGLHSLSENCRRVRWASSAQSAEVQAMRQVVLGYIYQ